MDVELIHEGVEVKVLEGPYLENGRPTSEAVEFYTRLVSRVDEFRRYAAGKLLSLYNDTWFDDEIGTIDADGFVERLANPVVTVYDEIGAAAVYFDDGDLFAGHYVDVTVSAGEPVDATIVG